MLEPGSEWFHVRTLAVVTVMNLETIDGTPHKVWLVNEGERKADGSAERGHVWWRDPEWFAENYRPNLPVTPELLEAMGWEAGGNERCQWRALTQDGRRYRLSWLDGTADGFEVDDIENYQGLSFPHPTKLRDLLNTMRCLGVQCQVPETISENPQKV